MTRVVLSQMLEARERRAGRQKALLAQYGLPLLSFTLNVPGPVKRNPVIERAYHYGLALLRERFSPVYVAQTLEDTGCEALLVVRGIPQTLKRRAVRIEECGAMGRLFDIDVLDPQGRQVSREELGLSERRCLLCDRPAHECARSRAHSVEELFACLTGCIERFFAERRVDRIASLAARALLFEVCATPKPGLVDRVDSGAHIDMDIFTFMSSVSVLTPYLRDCARLGMDFANLPPQALFERLIEPGLSAESAMYEATEGVNTHKGAIYSLGLACASCGRLYALDIPFSPEAALRLCGEMSREATERFFAELTAESARTVGDHLYLRYGLRGVRGEAADGFPAVLRVGLPALRKALENGLAINDAACAALLRLIAAVPDTVLIGRCSPATWRALAEALNAALEETILPDADRLDTLNRVFMQENLSPGGCADLLALTLFVHFVCTEN